MTTWLPLGVVALGGALGALCRYYFGLAIASRLGTSFPFGTLIINVTGCLFLGFFATFALDRAAWISPNARLFWATGFAGAYTTFSTFGFETLQLVEQGNLYEAMVNVAGSVVIGLAAVWLGAFLARLLPA